jgi:heme A synthase
MRLQRLSLVALLVTVLVIAWGAYVRASGSGAGCGAHWPMCNGVVMPPSPSARTVVELTHRLSSALDGLLALALVALAFRGHARGAPVRRWALAVLAFMLLEGAAGAALVKLELVANNASANRAVAMAVHLVLTFGLLAAMTGLAWYARTDLAPAGTSTRPRRAVLTLAMVVLTLVGVSGAVAALGDTLVQQSVHSPVVEALVQLRLVHPLLAIAGTGAVLGAVRVGWGAVATRRWALLTAGLLGLQVVAGLVNVILAAPVWLQLLHLTLADAVWVSLWGLSLAVQRADGALAAPGASP